MDALEKNGEKPPEKPLMQQLAEAMSVAGSDVLPGETTVLILNMQLGELDVAHRQMQIELAGVLVSVDGAFISRLSDDAKRIVDAKGRIIVPS